MSVTLTPFGLIAPYSLTEQKLGKHFPKMLEKLTIVYTPNIGAPIITIMYSTRVINGQKHIVVPISMLKVLKLVFPLRIAFCDRVIVPEIANAVFARPLYANQQLIVDYLLANVYTPELIATGGATTILNLRAGMGKTATAGGLIQRLGMPTLWITTKCELARQTVAELRSMFEGVNVELYGAPVKRAKKVTAKTLTAITPVENPPQTPHILVIVINSAMLREPKFFRSWGLVIYDEVHEYCSDKRSRIFTQTYTHARLGLSATTEQRGDLLDAVSHNHLCVGGSAGITRAEKIPGFSYDNVDFKGLVTLVNYYGKPENTQCLKHPSTDRMFTAYMQKQFIADDTRTTVVLKYLRMLYDLGHYIYVFCEEVEQVMCIRDRMRALLTPETDMPIETPELPPQTDKTIVDFVGGSNAEKVANARSVGRILLTTYAYSGTGTSIAKMDAIVFATPRKAKMMQIIARILRRDGNTEVKRQIIDIVDCCTPLRSQLKIRMAGYEFYNFEVINVTEYHAG